MISMILVSVLYVLAFVLAFAMTTRARLAGLGAIFLLALLASLAGYHLVIPAIAGPSLPPRPPELSTGGQMSSALCRQVVDETRRAGLFVGNPLPPRVVVRGSLWNQLPQQAKDAITTCLRGEDGEEVVVVER